MLDEERTLLTLEEERLLREELLLLVVVAEREEREEELLDPLTPLFLVGRVGVVLMVVPLSEPESSPFVGAVILPLLPVAREPPSLVVPEGLPVITEGRADEPPPPRIEVVLPPFVPLAICVPPREFSLTPPPNCSRYEGREVLPPMVVP